MGDGVAHASVRARTPRDTHDPTPATYAALFDPSSTVAATAPSRDPDPPPAYLGLRRARRRRAGAAGAGRPAVLRRPEGPQRRRAGLAPARTRDRLPRPAARPPQRHLGQAQAGAVDEPPGGEGGHLPAHRRVAGALPAGPPGAGAVADRVGRTAAGRRAPDLRRGRKLPDPL